MSNFRFGAILLVLCSAGTVQAQGGKFTATVKLQKIQIRTGHSWQFPAVGELKKGEQILVHHEEDDWVAIYPPPGSVSWVQARFLDRIDPNLPRQNVAIVIDPAVQAEVHLISPDAPKEINRIYQVKLPRGSIVEVVGKPIKDETTTWYPITPPEGEYRWIPKQAIGTTSPAAPPPEFVRNDAPRMNTVALRGDAKTGTDGPKPAAPALPAGWEKAEETERAGNYAEAETLYTKIYLTIRNQESDRELALVCYHRIVACQQRQKLEGSNPQRGAPATPTPRPTNSSNSPPASLTNPTPTPPANNIFTASGSNNATGQDSSGGSANASWAGPGILRRAGSSIDDRPAYALMDSKGKIICYATAMPGLDLERYLNQSISLLGKLETRGTIRGGPYMVVTETK